MYANFSILYKDFSFLLAYLILALIPHLLESVGDDLCDKASYNAFIVGELAPANLTQDNLEQIKPADVEEMDISWLMVMVVFRAKKEKRAKGIGYKECEPPFNHNYSIMPNINTSVDDLLLKSDRRCDFSTGTNKLVSLTADAIETSPNISDDSEMCADSLNKTGVRGKIEERSARRGTYCSTSFGTSSFISNTDFVGKVDEFKIKTNEMSKNFKSTFVKKNVILETISSCLHHEYKGHSTVTKEACSKLNPYCEPFVPTRSHWRCDPPVRTSLKPANHGSGATSNIDKGKTVKSKGVHKKEPITSPVPKPVMVWVPISH
ncbi:hypothetical protein R6Q57_003587 [Mikania cordata]